LNTLVAARDAKVKSFTYAAVIPKWTAALLQGDAVYTNGDGETTRDFCYVTNAVQANLLAATVEPVIASETRQSMNPALNQVYNVAVGDRTTISTLFALLRDNLAAHGVAANTQPVYRDFRAGDVRPWPGRHRQSSATAGLRPTHRLAEGIAHAMPWYVASKNIVK